MTAVEHVEALRESIARMGRVGEGKDRCPVLRLSLERS